MKYTISEVTFREFPDEISLCIDISNCKFHCSGCHSPELWNDIGIELTIQELTNLINKNKGITCVGFMGGDPLEVQELASIVKNNKLKVGWYWGGSRLPDINLGMFDYIKIGPYIKELGGLDNPKTNQRLYAIRDKKLIDITNKFWKI